MTSGLVDFVSNERMNRRYRFDRGNHKGIDLKLQPKLRHPMARTVML
jgi:hypothetical protein